MSKPEDVELLLHILDVRKSHNMYCQICLSTTKKLQYSKVHIINILLDLLNDRDVWEWKRFSDIQNELVHFKICCECYGRIKSTINFIKMIKFGIKFQNLLCNQSIPWRYSEENKKEVRNPSFSKMLAYNEEYIAMKKRYTLVQTATLITTPNESFYKSVDLDHKPQPVTKIMSMDKLETRLSLKEARKNKEAETKKQNEPQVLQQMLPTQNNLILIPMPLVTLNAQQLQQLSGSNVQMGNMPNIMSNQMSFVSNQMGNASGNIGNVGTTIGNISNHMAIMGNMTGNIGNVETSIGNMSNIMSNMSNQMAIVSNPMINVSGNIGNLATSIGNISNSIVNITNAIGNVKSEKSKTVAASDTGQLKKDLPFSNNLFQANNSGDKGDEKQQLLVKNPSLKSILKPLLVLEPGTVPTKRMRKQEFVQSNNRNNVIKINNKNTNSDESINRNAENESDKSATGQKKVDVDWEDRIPSDLIVFDHQDPAMTETAPTNILKSELSRPIEESTMQIKISSVYSEQDFIEIDDD